MLVRSYKQSIIFYHRREILSIMNFKITIKFNHTNNSNPVHNVRRSLNWVKGLVAHDGYKKYINDERFNALFWADIENDKTPTVKPFKAYIRDGKQDITIYIDSECPEAIYNLLLYYWFRRDKAVKLSYKRIFVDPDVLSVSNVVNFDSIE